MINAMLMLPDIWRFFKSTPLNCVVVAVAQGEAKEAENPVRPAWIGIPRLIHQQVNDD